MTAAEYRAALATLGLTQGAAGRVLGVDARTSRKWACEERAIPEPVARLLWACMRDRGLVTELLALTG